MQIELTKDYYIEIDPLNYTLKEKYIGVSKKTGEEVEAVRVHGYFGTLEPAIEKFLFLNQLACEPDTAMKMREYVEFVMTSNTQAVRAIKSLLGMVDVAELVEKFGQEKERIAQIEKV